MLAARVVLALLIAAAVPPVLPLVLAALAVLVRLRVGVGGALLAINTAVAALLLVHLPY